MGKIDDNPYYDSNASTNQQSSGVAFATTPFFTHVDLGEEGMKMVQISASSPILKENLKLD